MVVGSNPTLCNLILLDFTNSNTQIFRINIRRDEQGHSNNKSPFFDSPDLKEFEYKTIKGCSIAVGKQELSFHLPLNRFEQFKAFKSDNVRECFAIFSIYANISLSKEDENNLFYEL